MEKIIFDFDMSKCTACNACSMACMDQNDVLSQEGERSFRNTVIVEQAVDNIDKFSFLSMACMHCDDAPCIWACPAGCIYKDEETGLTLVDKDNCIGCHSCSMACPFGAPCFDKDGKMQKCDGCIERLKVGMKPACVKACPSGAITVNTQSEYNKNFKVNSLKQLAEKLIK